MRTDRHWLHQKRVAFARAHGQFGVKAGVSVYQPTAPHDQLQRLDAILDDGDLSTGSFRARAAGYIFIIED